MLPVLILLSLGSPAAAQAPPSPPLPSAAGIAISPELLTAYEAIRRALVDDNLAQVRSAAQTLVLASSTDLALSTAADALASAAALAPARLAFAEVSRLVVLRVAEDSAQPKVLVYFCPMFEGYAWWVQAKPGIQNPYMGQSMPQCGEERSLKAAAKAAAR